MGQHDDARRSLVTNVNNTRCHILTFPQIQRFSLESNSTSSAQTPAFLPIHLLSAILVDHVGCFLASLLFLFHSGHFLSLCRLPLFLQTLHFVLSIIKLLVNSSVIVITSNTALQSSATSHFIARDLAQRVSQDSVMQVHSLRRQDTFAVVLGEDLVHNR